MNIDKWDLFAIVESLLLVSDKPLTIEQVVGVLLAEQEAELERLEEEEDAAPFHVAKETTQKDPAFDRGLRSETASATLSADDAAIAADAEAEEEAPETRVASAPPLAREAADGPSEAVTAEASAETTEAVTAEASAETTEVVTAEASAETSEAVTAEASEASTEAVTADAVTAEASEDTTEAVTADASAETSEAVTAEASDTDEPQPELALKGAAPPSPQVLAQKAEARRVALVKRELTKLVQDAFDALMHVYAEPNRPLGRGFHLVQVAGAYQLRTSPTVAPFVRHLLQVKPTKLSRAQLEIMAIIAYRQPVTRPEIEQIRGVDCGAGLKVLLDRRLVRILGKKEEVGRPLLYGTSKEFLEFFRLGSLLELPTLREFQELTDEHRRQVDETVAAEAPLGNLRELVETGATEFVHDDSELIKDVDSALQGARATVNRVAELTGLKKDEDEPLPPQNSDPN
jgi:segregation and condensation protein B